MQEMRLQSASKEVHGTTPLLLACRAGDVKAIETCLERGACLQCSEKRVKPAYYIRKGQTPLHAAALSGVPEAAIVRMRVCISVCMPLNRLCFV